MSPGMYVGLFSNPAEFNYVNHPYPIIWLYALLYWAFGKLGMYLLIAAAGFAGCLLTYRFLTHFFPPAYAWLSTALLIASHATIEFATNTDVIAQGAIVWPLAGLVAIRLKETSNHPRTGFAWLIAFVVFLAGQISWFALTTIPALLLLSLPEEKSLIEALRRPWSVPGWLPILIGGTLSLAVFIGQILLYSPSLHGNAQYLGVQMGMGKSFIASRASQLPVLLLRMLLASPSLWLGAALGVYLFIRKEPRPRLLGAMLVYLGFFCLVVLAIPRLLLLNQHGFRYTLFPCAVLTAFALVSLPQKYFRFVLVAVALPALLFCYAKIHEYRASMASMTLGRWIEANTKLNEIVFTNLKYLVPPIQSWDGEFCNNTAVVADRFLIFGAQDEAEFGRAARPFLHQTQEFSFLRDNSQKMDPALMKEIESFGAPVLTTNLVVPNEGLLIFKTARAALWKVLKGNAPQYTAVDSGTESRTNWFSVALYRLPPGSVRALVKHADPKRYPFEAQRDAATPSNNASSIPP